MQDTSEGLANQTGDHVSQGIHGLLLFGARPARYLSLAAGGLAGLTTLSLSRVAAAAAVDVVVTSRVSIDVRLRCC